MRLRTVALNLALLGATTAVCLLLGEAAVRLLGRRNVAGPELSGAHEYDSLLGWRNRPLSSVEVATDEYRVVERFNSRGVRGPELAIPKPRGVRRVLLLGDSFVEGYTAVEESTTAAVLARELGRRWRSPVEVVNGGTAGYSTDQELLSYLHHLRVYRPDVVVLLPYVNDVWYNNRERYWRGFKPRFVREGGTLRLHNVPVPPPTPDTYAFSVEGGRGLVGLARRVDAWLGRSSRLYGLFREALKTTPVLSGLVMRLGLGAVPGEFLPWKVTPDTALASAWATTEALLAALRDSVRHDGARLVVFHVPARPAVYDDDWARTRRAYAFREGEWSPRQDAVVLQGMCARLALACVFPEPAFRRAAAEHPAERLYFRHDEHWTPAGYALAAREMADALAATP